MDQSYFSGALNQNLNNGAGAGAGALQNEQQNQDGQGLHYTLPGIMQYLQSQFTLVEKNRMMNDLEKSSLKLKIVELESERNSLKIQNDRLNLKVEELQSQLSSLQKKIQKEPNHSNDNETSLLKSLTRSNSRSKSRNGTKTTDRKLIDPTDDDDLLLDIKTIDVCKLVKARQFLKTATSEILYMLKSPTLELTDPINLTKEHSQDLYIDPNYTSTSPVTATRDINDLNLNESSSNGYVDMSISLAPPFKSKDTSNGLDSSLSEAESDTETIIESNNEQIAQASQQKKKMNVLKRSNVAVGIPGSTSTPSLLVNTIFTPSKCKLMNKMLLCYISERNIIKIWTDLEAKKSLRLTITLPSKIENIVNMIANDKCVVVHTTKEVLIYANNISIGSEISSPSFTHQSDKDIKDVDLKDDNILIACDSNVEVLKIDLLCKRLQPLFTSNCNNRNVLASKFITDQIGKFEISILTPDSLILQSIKQNPSILIGESDSNTTDYNNGLKNLQIIDLSAFDSFLLTSNYLVVSLSVGLFMMSFHQLDGMKTVPIASTKTLDLDYSVDDDSIFFNKNIVNSDSGSESDTKTIELQIFKVLKTGDIFNIKNLKIDSSSEWAFIGDLGVEKSLNVENAVGVGSSASVSVFGFQKA